MLLGASELVFGVGGLPLFLIRACKRPAKHHQSGQHWGVEHSFGACPSAGLRVLLLEWVMRALCMHTRSAGRGQELQSAVSPGWAPRFPAKLSSQQRC